MTDEIDIPLPANGADIRPAGRPEPIELGTREIPLGQPFDINNLIEGRDAAGRKTRVGEGVMAEYKNSKGESVPAITTDKEETFHATFTTYNAGGQAVIAYLTVVVKAVSADK